MPLPGERYSIGAQTARTLSFETRYSFVPAEICTADVRSRQSRSARTRVTFDHGLRHFLNEQRYAVGREHDGSFAMGLVALTTAEGPFIRHHTIVDLSALAPQPGNLFVRL